VHEALVLLHGFAATHRTWDGVIERLDAERYRPLALDLPGHGARSGERPITFESCVAAVLGSAPERFALCGYSMGGRIALALALMHPERVARLVLVACDPGIEDAAARADRAAREAELSRELERGGLEEFIGAWNGQPLFAGDPREVVELARADQERNDPLALGLAMRGLGTGNMPPLWDRLGELTMPITFVAGERDEKFSTIGARFAEIAPDARLLTLAGGHRLALENPAGVADAIASPQPEDAGSA
jgi:2-succinyl-6-hydroxy-2,4-cyclohexadiene-1-carboxylate synthase